MAFHLGRKLHSFVSPIRNFTFNSQIIIIVDVKGVVGVKVGGVIVDGNVGVVARYCCS